MSIYVPCVDKRHIVIEKLYMHVRMRAEAGPRLSSARDWIPEASNPNKNYNFEIILDPRVVHSSMVFKSPSKPFIAVYYELFQNIECLLI